VAYERINQLYYITHIKNLSSIRKLGILSHERVQAEGVQYEPVYDEQIVANRKQIITPDGRNLWSYANLYFKARNAMLYRVLFEKPVARTDEIVILGVRPDILNGEHILITTGNAASSSSERLVGKEGRKRIPEIRKSISSDWWTEVEGSKRKMMAECLVPDVVPAEYLQTVYVANHDVKCKVEEMLPGILEGPHLEVVPELHMFFLPSREIPLTASLSLAEGDLFFSRMQTLTVSVNCVGVMGKGLASRAKYQFPDVYVVYQDLCRQRKLRMGRPQLYKRESSLDYQLADEPSGLSNGSPETWFLLFPTKRHWKDRADIEGIDEGLKWLHGSYKTEGIKGLALPALGCGLGRLEWRDAGPLMCRYLQHFDIPTRIYLPAEKKVPDEFLTKEYLLGETAPSH